MPSEDIGITLSAILGGESWPRGRLPLGVLGGEKAFTDCKVVLVCFFLMLVGLPTEGDQFQSNQKVVRVDSNGLG